MVSKMNVKLGRHQFGSKSGKLPDFSYLGSMQYDMTYKTIEAKEILYNLYLQGFEVVQREE